ncbi:spore germination protein [Paenibacillus cremeus]|uniref:Spore germination protein n=1 Tax=Paenibacillus cremeus TaxID=2163881 RepID=A0A559K0I1_9BACL|nr:spore germination protein [Paenibacillus cremeus]TVY05596.1 spore germination protein [Paenibacillus cremeus]
MNKAKIDQQATWDWLYEKLGESSDFMYHDLVSDTKRGYMLFIRSLCDEEKVHKLIIEPFYKFGDFENYLTYLCALPFTRMYKTNQDTLDLVLEGCAVLFFDSCICLVDVGLTKNDSISAIEVESSIQGPENALSENILVNLNLIRNRYPQPSLRVEESTVGRLSKTKIAMLYDEQFTDQKTLQKVRRALSEVDADVIQAAGELHLYLTKKKRTLFPTMMTTERPDRIVVNLSHGKIAFLIEGTPFSLIIPAVFYDFMAAMDDFYVPFWVSRFLIGLRYVGLIMTLTLAAFYVAVTSYNPEVLRVQLALSIAGSRAPVPYPSYVEVLFMLLMMELLTEASLRLPKTIGSTATTVGGLILGQAATQAGLVSNIMIIIVSAVAISNYVIPIVAMSYGIRVAKYFILLLATFSGLIGVLIGIVALIAYLISLDSFGQPYLRMYLKNPLSIQKES